MARSRPYAPVSGKPWNFLVINCDDATLDLYEASPMPLFNANWASGFLAFPRASCNTPLCLPGRMATLSGMRRERHFGSDNNDGAAVDLTKTVLTTLQNRGYYTGIVGKWLNGFGEDFGTATRQAGVDFQRIQWGPPNYTNWTELDENGDKTTNDGSVLNDRVHGTTDSRAAYTDVTYTDYATDVEGDRVVQFLDNAAANGRPWLMYWAPKAPHLDSGGDPTPPARHAASSVTLTEDTAFGVAPATLGIPSWCAAVGSETWTQSDIDDIRATHTASLRTVRGLDEIVHKVLTKIAALGMDADTIVIFKTDNAHASGELRLVDKGTPHRSASSALLRIKVPTIAGGTRNHAASDIDIAPTICDLAAARPTYGMDGMSLARVLADNAAPFREAAPLSNSKDSPAFRGMYFADGHVYYRTDPASNKGADQAGGWNNTDMTTNVIVDQGDRAKLTILDQIVQGAPQVIRATISGADILDQDGNVLTLRGVNQATWATNYAPDAPAIAALGANVVRIPAIRWWGDSYSAGVDAYSSNAADDYIDPAHLQQGLQDIRWAVNAGLWVVVFLDSDNGAGNRGLGISSPNFFEATAEGIEKLAQFKVASRRVARELLQFDRILFAEIMAEPLPVDSDASWAATLRDVYRGLIANWRLEDPRTPFLLGARDSYAANYISEVILPERSDYALTSDFLTNKVSGEGTIVGFVEAMAAVRDANSIPIFQQQVGRNTNEDIGDVNDDDVGDTTENLGLTALCGVQSALNAHRIPFTWWQYHQNTDSPTAYALWYKTVYPGDGPDNWTPKPAEIAAFAYHMTQTGAAIEAAAVAAATAASGTQLFYVKSDLSNAYQTNDTSTPCTAVAQTVGRLNAVVGSGNFNQATDTVRPLLAATVNGYAMVFDGVDDWMGLDTTFFADGDNTIVIVAGRPAASAANRVMFQCGNSGATVRNPFLAVLASDDAQSSWRGDDNVLRAPAGVTACDDRATVVSGMKVGANKRLFVNGVQEGATNTDAVGSIASITRTRIGASTAVSNFFGGPIALVCVSKTLTDEQRRAIERWGAWLVGCPFRGAIPA